MKFIAFRFFTIFLDTYGPIGPPHRVVRYVGIDLRTNNTGLVFVHSGVFFELNFSQFKVLSTYSFFFPRGKNLMDVMNEHKTTQMNTSLISTSYYSVDLELVQIGLSYVYNMYIQGLIYNIYTRLI